MVSGNETRVMQKLVVIFFRKNVGVSYHNHDDDHHAIFGGHALPSVHKWGLKFYEFVFFFIIIQFYEIVMHLTYI